MLDLYKLQIFLVVAQEGSFSAAADRLYVTQSAVSQHIKDLETRLGRRLFQRGWRGVTLTPQGETLYSYAREIFALVARAEASLTDVEHLVSGRVSIAATPGVSVYLAPEWVGRFRAQYPRLTVALQTGITAQAVADVLARRVELGFIEGELDGARVDRLQVVPLDDITQFVIVGPNHTLWDTERVQLSDLHKQSFIMRPPNSKTRQWLDATLRGYGIEPVIGAEFDNIESIKRAVSSGVCLTVLPPYVVAGEVAAGSLRALPVEDGTFTRTLKLIHERDAYLSPVALAFLQTMAADYPALASLLAAE